MSHSYKAMVAEPLLEPFQDKTKRLSVVEVPTAGQSPLLNQFTGATTKYKSRRCPDSFNLPADQ